LTRVAERAPPRDNGKSMRHLLGFGFALVLIAGCGGITSTGDGEGPAEDGSGGGTSKGGTSPGSGGVTGGECRIASDCPPPPPSCEPCPDGSCAGVACVGGRCMQGVCPPSVDGTCDPQFCPGSDVGRGCCIGPNGPCGIDTGNGCGLAAKQRWYATCGDPVCSAGGPAGVPAPPAEPVWLPPCDWALGQAAGVDCDAFMVGTMCDAGLACGAYLVCAATDPTADPAGCPR